MPVFVALALFLSVLVLLPLFWLGYYSLTDKAGAATLANYVQLATDPTFVSPVLTILAISASVAVLSCMVAAPLAWLVARTDMPLRGTIRALVMASFVTPSFLGAVAWEILAAPNSGMLNQWYRAIFDAEPYDALFDIYTVEGVVFVITCYSFPYAFVLIANALDAVPGDLEDASAILGARRWTTLRRITLPIVLPAFLAGGLIAFMQTMTLFGAPAILAFPAGFHVLTTKIWSLFQFPANPNLAAAASMPLLFLTILLLRAQRRLLGRRSYAVVGGRSGPPRLWRLGGWRIPSLVVALLILSLPLLLPYGALLKTALVRIASEPLNLDTLTLHNVRFVFLEFSATQLALCNTVLLGLMAATLGTGLAVIIGYLTGRRLITGHRFLDFLATAPVAIPGIVLGVGLFLSYSRPPLVLYGTLWILLMAFLTIELPAGYQQIQAAFRGIHPEMEEASRILGGTRLQALRHITAPLLRTSVITTWCFIFIGVIRELSATIMLTTAPTKLVSVIIYDLNESGDLGAISVLGLTLLAITFAVVGLANRLPSLAKAAPRPA
ncbi:MAG: iron ABC transporter permease [Proteobacteria bacterium]|nr:iron ABC transporter permease [Pseudomonadota bacterium]